MKAALSPSDHVTRPATQAISHAPLSPLPCSNPNYVTTACSQKRLSDADYAPMDDGSSGASPDLGTSAGAGRMGGSGGRRGGKGEPVAQVMRICRYKAGMNARLPYSGVLIHTWSALSPVPLARCQQSRPCIQTACSWPSTDASRVDACMPCMLLRPYASFPIHPSPSSSCTSSRRSSTTPLCRLCSRASPMPHQTVRCAASWTAPKKRTDWRSSASGRARRPR